MLSLANPSLAKGNLHVLLKMDSKKIYTLYKYIYIYIYIYIYTPYIDISYISYIFLLIKNVNQCSLNMLANVAYFYFNYHILN